MLLLDTDACIDVLRGTKRATSILDLVGEESVAVAAVTVHELAEGARRARDPGRERRVVDRFLSAFDIVPYDAQAAWIGGSIAGDLARAGAPIGDLDTMIAASALHAGCPVVTSNARHFSKVAGLTVIEP